MVKYIYKILLMFIETVKEFTEQDFINRLRECVYPENKIRLRDVYISLDAAVDNGLIYFDGNKFIVR